MSATAPFTLTDVERDAIAARAALRNALGGALSVAELAPLALFGFVLLGIAMTAWLGLLPRRPAEIALILAAAAFMARRLWTHRRLVATRRKAKADLSQQTWLGELRFVIDDEGFRLEAEGGVQRLSYSEADRIERAADLHFAWSRKGDLPLVWPARALDSEEAAEAFLAEARAQLRRARRVATPRAPRRTPPRPSET